MKIPPIKEWAMDAHIYGGLVFICAGLWSTPRWGLVALGLGLFYLGALWRPTK